jgi:hypothetical protein
MGKNSHLLVWLLLQMSTAPEEIVSILSKAMILKSYSPICEKRILWQCCLFCLNYGSVSNEA